MPDQVGRQMKRRGGRSTCHRSCAMAVTIALFCGVQVVMAVAVRAFDGNGGAQESLDVVELKGGGRVAGFIVSETREEIVILVARYRSDGATKSVTRVVLRREQIERVHRAGTGRSESLVRRARAHYSRELHLAQRMSCVKVVSGTLAGQRAWICSGEYFTVVSQVRGEVGRRVVVLLDEIWEAYSRSVLSRSQRGASDCRPIRVYLFAVRAGYERYLRELYGKAVKNPALYDPSRDLVIAYSFEADKVSLRSLRRRILLRRRELRAERKRVEEVAWELERTVERLRQLDLPQSERDRIEAKFEEQSVQLRKYRTEICAEQERLERTSRQIPVALKEYDKQLLSLLFHECFHAFSRHNFASASPLPHWLEEGIATYFEQSAVEGDVLIHGGTSPELREVFLEAYRAGRLLPIPTLLRDRGEVFVVSPNGKGLRSRVAYAESWALVHFLRRRIFTGRLDEYLADLARGMNPDTAFEKLSGKPIAELEQALVSYVKTLPE